MMKHSDSNVEIFELTCEKYKVLASNGGPELELDLADDSQTDDSNIEDKFDLDRQRFVTDVNVEGIPSDLERSGRIPQHALDQLSFTLNSQSNSPSFSRTMQTGKAAIDV